MVETIETGRLILRTFTQGDLKDFYEYAKNPDIGIHAGWKPHESILETEMILSNFMKTEVWAIVLKKENKVIGSIGLHDDVRRQSLKDLKSIGYVISKDYWGDGFATEATTALMNYVFNKLKMELLSIYHYPDNNRSRRVIEKSGFKFEGILRAADVRYNGESVDLCSYSITEKEFKTSIIDYKNA